MKIQVIIPIIETSFNEKVEQEVDSVRAPDCEISLVNIEKGTRYIQSRYAEYLDTGEIVRLSREAQDQGFDGIFVDCFGEPGVSEVRELVEIPVIGGFDAAVLSATIISQRFSIITVVKSVLPMFRGMARALGIIDNITSIREVDIPVLGLQDEELLKFKLLEESQKAIQEDGAEAIVLGCTGMLNVAKDVEKELKLLEMPAPVVDPTTAAIGFLQSLIRNGFSQSRLTYYKSDAKSE